VSDDIRIAACREAELPALMRFIGTHWRAGHILSRDETLLRWQFDPTLIKGRSLPGPSVMLAWHGDEIVGILGLIGFDLNVAGVPVAGAWLSHWFAVPEYRARNVATRLILAVRGLGLEVLGAVGANDVSKKALLAWGWELIPDLPRWIGVIDRPQTTALLSASGAAVAPEAAEELCGRHLVVDGAQAPASAERLEVVPWTADLAEAWDRCWRERLAQTVVGNTRDSAYLRWRYAKRPRFRYEMWVARHPADGSVAGIAVFRLEQVSERPERVLRVVEFLASPEAEPSLAQFVAQAARDHGVAFADFYCSSARAARGLERIGFKLAPTAAEAPAFPCRLQPLEGGHYRMMAMLQLPSGLGGKLESLIETVRLYVTKSDGDQDRPN